jgi:Tfp pilus assembly protein PilV
MSKVFSKHVAAGQEGFSLLETMIAAALGLVITAAALDVFVLHHGHFLGQRGKSELQQDVRAGVNLMGAELRLASPITAMQNEEVGFRANVNDVQGTLLVAAAAGQSSAHVTPSSGWVRGKTVRFCSALVCEEQALARDGKTGHLSLSGSLFHEFPAGGHIELINEVRYYLSRTSSNNLKLMREIDRGANPLIEHVENFLLTYLNADGQPAGRRQEVRLIRLQIRTSGSDGRGGRIFRTHNQDMGVRAL